MPRGSVLLEEGERAQREVQCWRCGSWLLSVGLFTGPRGRLRVTRVGQEAREKSSVLVLLRRVLRPFARAWVTRVPCGLFKRQYCLRGGEAISGLCGSILRCAGPTHTVWTPSP